MDYHYCEYEVYDRDYPEFTSQWTFGGLYTAAYTGWVQFDYPSPSSFGLFCPRVLHQGTHLLYNPGAGSQTDTPNRIIITWMVLLCFCGVEYIGGLLGIMAVSISIIRVSPHMTLLVLALTAYHYCNDGNPNLEILCIAPPFDDYYTHYPSASAGCFCTFVLRPHEDGNWGDGRTGSRQ